MQNPQHQVLLTRIAELEKIVSKQSERISRLEQDNLALHRENAELKAHLRVYENPHTPSSKQRFKQKPREPSGKLGAPIGHPKWEREQPESTETVEHSETECPYCRHRLGKPIRTDRRIIEELPEPQPIKVTEHLINHYHCNHCHRNIIAGNNVPRGMFGINAQATTVLLRFEARLPLRKAVNALTRQGLNMTNVCVQKLVSVLHTAYRPNITSKFNCFVHPGLCTPMKLKCLLTVKPGGFGHLQLNNKRFTLYGNDGIVMFQ